MNTAIAQRLLRSWHTGTSERQPEADPPKRVLRPYLWKRYDPRSRQRPAPWLSGVLVAAAAGALMAGCGEGQESTSSRVPRDAATAGSPDSNAPDSVTGQPPTPTESGPESPQVGQYYPVTVYSHCGIRFMEFGDRHWKAENPVPAPTPRPNSQGIVEVDNYTPGMVTLIEQDTLKFAVDDSAVQEQNIVVYFHPTTKHPPPCA